MSKCHVCEEDQAIYAFQPFGPDDEPHKHMMLLGAHYPGFPVVKLCEMCHDMISTGVMDVFMFKGMRYIYADGRAHDVPEEVTNVKEWYAANYEEKK